MLHQPGVIFMSLVQTFEMLFTLCSLAFSQGFVYLAMWVVLLVVNLVGNHHSWLQSSDLSTEQPFTWLARRWPFPENRGDNTKTLCISSSHTTGWLKCPKCMQHPSCKFSSFSDLMKIKLPLLCRLLLMHYATDLGRFHLLHVLLNQIITELAPGVPLMSSEHRNDLGVTVSQHSWEWMQVTAETRNTFPKVQTSREAWIVLV